MSLRWMVPLWSSGRDSDLDLRSGHSLADSMSSFLCSDLYYLGGLIWVNHETICKQRCQCIKLPWGILCTFPVSRILLPTAWGPLSISGCLVAICLLTEQRAMSFASRKSVSTPYLRQRTWMSSRAKLFPSLFLREKVYKTSPHVKQNFFIRCANVYAVADQVRWF